MSRRSKYWFLEAGAQPAVLEEPGVYVILHTKTRMVYVGQTSNMKKRWASHRAVLRGRDHSNHELQELWNLGSPDEFLFIPIRIEANPVERIAREDDMIYCLRSRGHAVANQGFWNKKRVAAGRPPTKACVRAKLKNALMAPVWREQRLEEEARKWMGSYI